MRGESLWDDLDWRDWAIIGLLLVNGVEAVVLIVMAVTTAE